MSDTDEFSITRPRPLFLRIMFGAGGLFTIVVPAWEFRQAFLHPGWLTLFFGLMTLGAWWVGSVFVAASLFDEDQRWQVRHGEIEIKRQNALRQWTTIIRAADVRATTIKETSWDSGPDTFSVVLNLYNGERFETNDYEKRDNAVALEARLRARLCLD